MISARPGTATRRPVVAVAVLFAVVVAALVVAIAAAHVSPAGKGRVESQAPVLPGRLRLAPTQSASQQYQQPVKPNAGSEILTVVLFTGVAVVLGAILFLVLRFLFGLVRSIVAALRSRRRPPIVPPSELAPDDLVGHIAAAVDAALADLATDRPAGDAIIQCWQRLTTAAAEAGIAPVQSDTPDETIRRIFFATEVSAAPLRRLAELYREARFSRHTMGPDHANAARDALAAILAELPRSSDVPV
jgi:hypothetical protein